MRLIKKARAFLDRPRESRILANANRIVYEKGFVWKYLSIVLIISYIVMLFLIVISILNKCITYLVFNIILTICLIFAHIKLIRYKFLFQKLSAYDILYSKDKNKTRR